VDELEWCAVFATFGLPVSCLPFRFSRALAHFDVLLTHFFEKLAYLFVLLGQVGLLLLNLGLGLLDLLLNDQGVVGNLFALFFLSSNVVLGSCDRLIDFRSARIRD